MSTREDRLLDIRNKVCDLQFELEGDLCERDAVRSRSPEAQALDQLFDLLLGLIDELRGAQ